MKTLLLLAIVIVVFSPESYAEQNSSGYTKSYKGYSSESRRSKRDELERAIEVLKAECESPKKSFLPKCRSLKNKLEKMKKYE